MSISVEIDEADLSEGFYSPAQLAAILPGVSRNTLAAWRHEQKGPAYYKAGRFIFYPKRAFKAWLARGFHGGDL